MSAERGPVWSEYGLLLAAAVAAAVTVDPLQWRLAANPVVKHLAWMILVPSLLLTIVGRQIDAPLRQRRFFRPVLLAAWPLVLLAVFIVAGGLYARTVLDIQNTFLNVGLYMLVTIFTAAMIVQTGAVSSLLRAYFLILMGAGSVMAVYLVANFGVRQVYHEQIFLVIPLAVWFFARARSILHHAAGIFFLSMAWFSQKYTAYIVGALTVAYVMLMIVQPRLASRPAVSRAAVAYWSWLLFALAALAFILWAQRNPGDMPTGNLEYRLHTYEAAWGRFKASPVWGSLFAAEAAEKFSLYSIGIARNVLPTHSDVLDLLGHGGIVALLLWLMMLIRIGRIAHGRLLTGRRLGHPWAPYAHALAMMSIAGVVTYAFNPILLQPAMAFLLWANLGILLGLSLRMGEPADAYAPLRRDGHVGAGVRAGGGSVS